MRTGLAAFGVGVGLGLGLGLAGCGRLGFTEAPAPDDGGDGAAGDTVTVVVTSDQYLAEPAGRPIAGATVLVERAGGTDRLATNAAGIARFRATGALACHVIYKGDLGWRGYTVEPPVMAAAATIELGSRPASNPSHNVTFALPGNANAASFTVRLPARCAFPGTSSSPAVPTPFDATCEGTAVHAFGFALPASGSGSPDLYVDAGTVTLANNATLPVTGDYQPVATRTLQVANLPAATDSVSAELVQRSGLDLTSLTPTPAGAIGNATSATLRLGAAPGGNGVSLTAFAVTPVQLLSTSTLIAPLGLATSANFDAGDMLPLFGALNVGDPTRMTWTGGEGGTITIVERNAGGVQWDWYLPASATAAQLPAIPDDLGVPGSKPVDFAVVTRLAVPGARGGELLPTIDRRWSLWPYDAMLFPDAGSAEARILYSAGRGP